MKKCFVWFYFACLGSHLKNLFPLCDDGTGGSRKVVSIRNQLKTAASPNNDAMTVNYSGVFQGPIKNFHLTFFYWSYLIPDIRTLNKAITQPRQT